MGKCFLSSHQCPVSTSLIKNQNQNQIKEQQSNQTSKHHYGHFSYIQQADTQLEEQAGRQAYGQTDNPHAAFAE